MTGVASAGAPPLAAAAVRPLAEGEKTLNRRKRRDIMNSDSTSHTAPTAITGLRPSASLDQQCGNRMHRYENNLSFVPLRGNLPLVFALLAAVLTAGCRSGTEEVVTGPCRVMSPPHPVEINVIGYPSKGMAFFGNEMRACNQVANIMVNHQTLRFDEFVSKAKINMASTGVSRYQIIHAYDKLLFEWAPKGWLTPLDDYLSRYRDKYDLSDIPEATWDLVTYEGHTYMIPAIHNTEVFVYRKDLFDKYGLSTPQTTDDVISVAEALRHEDDVQYPLAMMYGSLEFSKEFHNMITSLGGRWFAEDGHPLFNSEAGLLAIEKMQEMYRFMDPDTMNLNYEDLTIGLQQGQFAMGLVWFSQTAAISDPESSPFAGKFGFAPAPAACDGCPPAAYWAQDGWVIPRNSGVDAELLTQVALEGVDTESQSQATGFALVTRASLANATKSEAAAAAFETIARGARALPKVPSTYLAQKALDRFGIQALQGKLSAKKALDQAAEQYTVWLAAFLKRQGEPDQDL